MNREEQVFKEILDLCQTNAWSFNLNYYEWSNEWELRVYCQSWYVYYNKKWWLSDYVPDNIREHFKSHLLEIKNKAWLRIK